MALTPNQQIIFNAVNAIGLLGLQNPTLATNLKNQFRNDKYKYTPRLQALISMAPAELQHPLYAYYSNPAAVKESISDAFSKTFGSVAQSLATAAGKAGQAPVQLAQGIAHVDQALTSLNPLAGLFQANIWLRVAEVGIGVLLLAVGIAKLTNAVPIASKIAGGVSKMPIPV